MGRITAALTDGILGLGVGGAVGELYGMSNAAKKDRNYWAGDWNVFKHSVKGMAIGGGIGALIGAATDIAPGNSSELPRRKERRSSSPLPRRQPRRMLRRRLNYEEFLKISIQR